MDIRFEAIVRSVAELPYVGQGIQKLKDKYPDRYEVIVERHLAALDRYYGGSLPRMEQACSSFVEMTFEILRMQNRFFRTGEFSLPKEELHKIYADAEYMVGPYLTGLFLSAVFWVNHFEKMIYFEDVFVPRLPSRPRVLDVGPGSGLFTALTLLYRPGAEVTANDISSYSEPMVRGVRFGQESPKGTPRFILGEFPDSLKELDECFDVVLFSDVVEHLPHPEKGLESLKRLLVPGGMVFFATATNAAFYDHTIIFDDVSEVESLLEKHGFEVLCPKTVKVFKNRDGRNTVDYLAILKQKG